MEFCTQLTIHAEWQWRKEILSGLQGLRMLLRGDSCWNRWSRMCFGETQRCRRPSTQEAVTGRQTGDHLGNISMSVWNCRVPAGGPGVCEGEAGGEERNPPSWRPRPKASVVLPLFGSVCYQVCVLRECNGKRHFNHNFFLINHHFLKEHLHIDTHKNRRV